MPDPGPILALDVGAKRVGYAVTDPSQQIAFPRTFLLRQPNKDEALIEEIRRLALSIKAVLFVVGLPLDSENEEGERAQGIRLLAEKIGAACELPLAFVDESFSTQEARARIPLKRDRKKKGSDDAIAAQIILERYLAGREEL
ncbi:Holliday junction resolvase RuvX [Candidatus Peregrinibacteria bacterium CG_4_9_14_0_2_um_filter_53_11]|nr:MAG: Holliday junction resolvase RuvX [Candidatus Peregrinibacteria bacterium CG_4_9_14_0_2_um_filter_53_11]